MSEVECNCILENLFKSSFSSRSNFSEKLAIINAGRPTPCLNHLKTEIKDGKKSYFRSFQTEWYTNTKWLCGCLKLEKLFCWPCVLFGMDNDSATAFKKTGGVRDMRNFQNLKKRHEKSVSHINSMVSLIQFGKNRIEPCISQAFRDNIEKHNETVKENRYILECLIDATCYLALQELPFRGHDESSESLNKGNYVELLDLMAKRDDRLRNHLKNSTVFIGTSKTIQNELIECITALMIEEIKNEVNRAPFVAIMLDETTDVAKKSQLSTTIRYISNQNIAVERFVRFSDVSDDRSAPALYEYVLKFMQEFNCGNKLIAQTYDGAAVMSGQHNGLQKLVTDQFEQAQFVHCYAHQLNLVLKQSVSSIKECNIFFETLSGFPPFFSKSTKRTNFLDEQVKRRLPSASATRWNSNSKLVEVISATKEDLKIVFQNMTTDFDTWKDSETRVCAHGFLHFLQDFEFNFLLKTFEAIFPHATKLFNILQKKIFDIQLASKEVENFKLFLNQMRDKFEIIYGPIAQSMLQNSTADEDGPTSSKRICTRDSSDTALDPAKKYRRIFYEIIDNITMHISDRFSEIKKMEYLALLDSDKFENYEIQFPDSLFQKLMTHPHGKNFDFVRLKSELIVVFSSPMFRGFSPFAFYFHLQTSGLSAALTEVEKLYALVLTIPVTSASTERSFSALKRIKTFQRSTQTQERLTGLALMSIEKELLRQLWRKPDFYDRVIELFVQKSRRMDFIYK